jgi:hypothetical protein
MKPPKILGIIGGIGKIEKMERKPKEFSLLLIGTRLRDGIWKRNFIREELSEKFG